MASAAAAKELLALKLQVMEVEGLPAWKVQAADAEEREKICSSLRNKMHELRVSIKDLPQMSETERGARKAKVKEECRSLMQVLLLVAAMKRTPDYSGMIEAECVAEVDRLRQQMLEEAHRLKVEGDPEWWGQERLARIMYFDPMQDAPFGPMRFKDEVYGSDTPEPCEAISILSVNIACSDGCFPMQVYGSVIPRDIIDHKCVYIFRADRECCQLISSKVTSLSKAHRLCAR